jgi:MerR family transcriptional regulator, light-induced transcriptional regulator
METLLSPRQVALAMGVSESSLKRWCDRGLLQTRRTAGGHRRLPIDSVMQFVRDSGQSLPRPELLGLPSTTGKGSLVLDRAVDQMVQALETGDEELSTRIVFDLYLAHQSATDICDKVIAAAFHRIGTDWECGGIEVYQERRGCEVCLHTLFALRSAMSRPKANAPRAVGGTFSNDEYRLPTTMVEIALREANWHAESLGTNLTADTLCAAMRKEKPRLLWLSASHIENPETFLAAYAKLAETAAAENVAIAVGGRALVPELRQQMEYAAYCDNLRHLTALAKSLAPKRSATSAKKSRAKPGKNTPG